MHQVVGDVRGFEGRCSPDSLSSPALDLSARRGNTKARGPSASTKLPRPTREPEVRT